MIDRKKVVERNHPVINKLEPLSPLSVGNGEFAFTADITGLQTFPESYEMPLGTQSHWGWHYTDSSTKHRLKDLSLDSYETYGREVGYPLFPKGEDDHAYHWLRQNPHRIQLGQLSFVLTKENGKKAVIEDIEGINQVLQLWNGTLYSEFQLEGVTVSVTTSCDPHSDQLGVKVESSLVEQGRLQVAIRFPNPDMTSRTWEESIQLNWKNDERHETILQSETDGAVLIERKMDEDRYFVKWSCDHGTFEKTGVHECTLVPNKQRRELCFSIGYSLDSLIDLSPVDTIVGESAEYWESFWRTGGAIDFSGSSDERATELERRVVLSQFLTAIHSGGSIPPQETGLLYNSWFGKFHLEMHWWHGAHFPLWGREEILMKSMNWYNEILPLAKELAVSQGYDGARWPKMVGVDGEQTPSTIAPVLIWQQPHPIMLAELCYQGSHSRELLVRWREIVYESANFMASYAQWDEEKEAYVLGPPLIPAQECHKPEESWNPPYELEYWKYGLELAVLWADRLGDDVNPEWEAVANSMAPPPQKDGVYLAHENCPSTYESFNHDHPSMVGALGLLPGALIDKEVMKATLKRVRADWQWETAWGWDFPMCAMTAARLGEGEMAVDFLLMEATKNTYLPNGHNYQRSDLMAYLPGNGGLLTAIAMMAAGWQGAADRKNPGFPDDGSWVVEWEGLKPIL
ncbi:glycoside hydrolase family 65 [Evansella sp. AB-P1]|uniref:glycoside hydrolase family 65 n=1 Tax=Evansella sp. AB-P1 TaxID=3037653 RepID=UPI00241D11C3|nr:glycoside hydrolase family 65 [Evansella sp. AB-P1]MDG5786719.1 glycoside hydrolase family 65 [Evansella sp. AB-P1]